LSLFQESESKNNYISKGHIYKDLYISKLLTHLYNIKENTNIRFKKKIEKFMTEKCKKVYVICLFWPFTGITSTQAVNKIFL